MATDATTPRSPDPDDAVLLERMRAGDNLAFEEFTRAHLGRVLAVARRLLDNLADAQEAVQEAFLSFFRGLSTFRSEARLSTWLHKMVVNAALMKRRARSRRPERTLDDLLPKYLEDGHRSTARRPWPQPPATLLEQGETRDLVRDKLAELAEEHRTILLLRDVEGIDTAETAAILGIKGGAVKTRLHRARQAPRTLLEESLADG